MAARDHHWGKSWGTQPKRWNVGCVGSGKDIKKIFSLNRVSLNNPPIILCFTARHWAMLCSLALISADSQIERRSSEAGRSVRGCGEWLAGHLTVGYQRDNNVWRQAGAMYVLQKNNCYPFKSHFLIGLAVVERNLEKRQVRDRLREREEKELEEDRERALCCYHYYNYVSEGPNGTYK